MNFRYRAWRDDLELGSKSRKFGREADYPKE